MEINENELIPEKCRENHPFNCYYGNWIFFCVWLSNGKRLKYNKKGTLSMAVTIREISGWFYSVCRHKLTNSHSFDIFSSKFRLRSPTYLLFIWSICTISNLGIFSGFSSVYSDCSDTTTKCKHHFLTTKESTKRKWIC